jgi:hypothetical protein
MKNKYIVKGSYTQHFECIVEADSEDEAYDLALSGEEDYENGNCNHWQIDSIEVK